MVETSKENTRGRSRKLDGVVVSNKMDKTIVVAITRLTKHPVYGKYVRKTKKCYAHDEKKQCKPGDIVRIVETRPTSKLKRWKLEKVLIQATE